MTTRNDIVKLFKTEAAHLDPLHETPPALIVELAQVIADIHGNIRQDDFDLLIRIGAVMYRDGLHQYRARREIIAIMQQADGVGDDSRG